MDEFATNAPKDCDRICCDRLLASLASVVLDFRGLAPLLYEPVRATAVGRRPNLFARLCLTLAALMSSFSSLMSHSPSQYQPALTQ